MYNFLYRIRQHNKDIHQLNKEAKQITQKEDRYTQHIEGWKRKPPSATKNKNSIYKSR